MKNHRYPRPKTHFSVTQILASKLTHRFVREVKPDLPLFVQDYRLKAINLFDSTDRAYTFGRYQNSSGQEAIAKVWAGGVKDFNYWSLKNEILIYEAISDLDKNEISQLLSKAPFVNTPKLIAAVETKNQLILLISHVEYPNMMGKSAKKISDSFFLAQRYVQELGKVLLKHPNASQQISTRTNIDLILITFLAYLKAIFHHPTKCSLITTVFFEILSTIPTLFKDKRRSLVHRSLEDHNLLSNGNAITLIDFQLAVFAHPFIELSQILIFSWSNKELRESILQSRWLQSQMKTERDLRVFRFFLLQAGLQQLAERVMPDEQLNNYMQFASSVYTKLKPTGVPNKEPHQRGGIPEKAFFFWLTLLGSCLHKTRPLSLKITKFYWKEKKAVLCFHDVSDSSWRFSSTERQLIEQLRYLKMLGKIVSLKQALKDQKTERPQFVVTFDDGYKSVATTVAPILKKEKISAVAFVLACPESVNRHQLQNDLPLMTFQQVKELIDQGWEVGYHTAKHNDLRYASKEALNEDLVVERKKLEIKLGTPLRYFAYPRGGVSRALKTTLMDSNFTYAFTTSGLPLPAKISDPYLLSRIPIEGEYTSRQFEALFSPLGIHTFQLFLWLLRCKERFSLHLQSGLFRVLPS